MPLQGAVCAPGGCQSPSCLGYHSNTSMAHCMTHGSHSKSTDEYVNVFHRLSYKQLQIQHSSSIPSRL